MALVKVALDIGLFVGNHSKCLQTFLPISVLLTYFSYTAQTPPQLIQSDTGFDVICDGFKDCDGLCYIARTLREAMYDGVSLFEGCRNDEDPVICSACPRKSRDPDLLKGDEIKLYTKETFSTSFITNLFSCQPHIYVITMKLDYQCVLCPATKSRTVQASTVTTQKVGFLA